MDWAIAVEVALQHSFPWAFLEGGERAVQAERSSHAHDLAFAGLGSPAGQRQRPLRPSGSDVFRSAGIAGRNYPIALETSGNRHSSASTSATFELLNHGQLC
jgi:hypothetical protein